MWEEERPGVFKGEGTERVWLRRDEEEGVATVLKDLNTCCSSESSLGIGAVPLSTRDSSYLYPVGEIELKLLSNVAHPLLAINMTFDTIGCVFR